MWPIFVCSVVMHYILIWWWCQVNSRPIGQGPLWSWQQWLHYLGDLVQNIHRNWNIGDGSVGDNHGCGVYGDGAILTILAMKTLALTRRAVLTTNATILIILTMKCWQQLRPWHWGWIVTLGPLVTRFHQGQGPFMLEMALVMMMMMMMIYIYYDAVSVCLSVTKNHHFQAGRWRRKAGCSLGLAGVRRPALA